MRAPPVICCAHSKGVLWWHTKTQYWAKKLIKTTKKMGITRSVITQWIYQSNLLSNNWKLHILQYGHESKLCDDFITGKLIGSLLSIVSTVWWLTSPVKCLLSLVTFVDYCLVHVSHFLVNTFISTKSSQVASITKSDSAQLYVYVA